MCWTLNMNITPDQNLNFGLSYCFIIEEVEFKIPYNFKLLSSPNYQITKSLISNTN